MVMRDNNTANSMSLAGANETLRNLGSLNAAPRSRLRDQSNIVKPMSALSHTDELKKRELLIQPAKKAVIERGKLIISYPTLQAEDARQQSLQRIQTVDLATAARKDKAHRRTFERSASVGDPAPRSSNSQHDSTKVIREISRASFAINVARDTSPGPSGSHGLGADQEPSATKAKQEAPAFMKSRKGREPNSSHKSPTLNPVRSHPKSSVSGLSPIDMSISEAPKARQAVQNLSPQTHLRALEALTTSPLLPSPADEMLADTKVSPVSATSPKRTEILSSQEIAPARRALTEILVPPLRPLSPQEDTSSATQRSAVALSDRTAGDAPSGVLRSLSVKNGIRPSRQRPVTPPTGGPSEESKATRTPFQLKGAKGLPRNPRAQTKIIAVTGESNSSLSAQNSVVYRPRPVERRVEGNDSPRNSGSSTQHETPIRRSTIGASSQLSLLPSAARNTDPVTTRQGDSRLAPWPMPPKGKGPTFAKASSMAPQTAPDYNDTALRTSSKTASKFSLDTGVSSMDGSYTSTSQSPALTLHQTPQDELRRRSSPVIPENMSSSSARTLTSGQFRTSTEIPKLFGSSRAMGAIRSGAPSEGQSLNKTRASYSEPRENMDRETVTFMLVHSTDETNGRVRGTLKRSPAGGFVGRRGSWHRRVGDNCPTFSDVRSRKSRSFLRPPPLPLHSLSNLARDAASQSPALETPRKALDMIHEQLQRFEQANEGSSDSATRRVALLMDLEQEMGEQEDRWKQMRDGLSRASVSTSVYDAESRYDSPASLGPSPAENQSSQSNGSDIMEWPPSAVLYTASEVQISRLDRPMQINRSENGADKYNDMMVSLEVSTEANGTAAENEDRRLTNLSKICEASIEENARPHEQADMNGLAVKKIPAQSARTFGLPEAGNQPAIQTPVAAAEATGSYPGPLELDKHSTGATKPSEDDIPRGLPAHSRGRASKPPKRSRRMTALPDILENPEPIRDKHGTLGIYQFPWGELSDTATIPTATQSQMSRDLGPGTANWAPTYLTLEAQVQQQIQEDQQTLKSFFNYYDSEDGADTDQEMGNLPESSKDVELSDDGDDDSFDESTLWEIANLLNFRSLPSKNSLLPSLGSSQEMPLNTSDMKRSSRSREIPSVPAEESQPRIATAAGPSRRQPPSPIRATQYALWVNTERTAVSSRSVGLPQPETKDWSTYTSLQGQSGRTASRKRAPDTVSSQELWSKPKMHLSRSSIKESSALWAPQVLPNVSASSFGHKESSLTSLWALPTAQPKRVLGLVSHDPERWDAYTNVGPPIPNVSSRAHNIAPLESTSLWSVQERSKTPLLPFRSTAVSTAISGPISTPVSALASNSARNGNYSSSLWKPPSIRPSQEYGLVSHEPGNWDMYLDMGSQIRFSSTRAHSVPKVESTALWSQGRLSTAVASFTARELSLVRLWTPPPQMVQKNAAGTISHDTEKWITYTDMGAPIRFAIVRDDKSLRIESTFLWNKQGRLTTASSSVERVNRVFRLWAPGPPVAQEKVFGIVNHTPEEWNTYTDMEPPIRLARVRHHKNLNVESTALWNHKSECDILKQSSRSIVSSPTVSESGTDDESETLTDSSSIHSGGTSQSSTVALAVPSDRLAPQFVTDSDWKSTLSSRRHSTAPLPNWSAALHESAGAAARTSVTIKPTWWAQHLPQSAEELGVFDPARHHPVFNVYVFDSSEGMSHPAAIGYVNALVNHNSDLVLNRGH